jgi:penicillin-insensitive murein DD-endopeptidase
MQEHYKNKMVLSGPLHGGAKNALESAHDSVPFILQRMRGLSKMVPFKNITRFCALLIALGLAGFAQAAEPLAKDLFGAQKTGAPGPASSYGFYSKGCFAGGVAIATDGPTWQVMRLSRNRMWGHPQMIALLEDLSQKAVAGGWPGLLLGDISQPRGGPMLTGHASHQIGLDADIWLTKMPDKRLTAKQREDMAATSMLKKGSLYVNDAIWTEAHGNLIRQAASYPNVERVLVHPGIKKKLCDTMTGDRSWLSKVRPFWGHEYHMHVRLACPKGSPGCKGQEKTQPGDGCGKDLAWWFTNEPWKKAPPGTKPKPPARDTMTMASLPAACRAVLDGGDKPATKSATKPDAIAKAIDDGAPAVPEARPDN